MKDEKIITMKTIHSFHMNEMKWLSNESHGRISPARAKSNPVLMMIPNLQGVNMWSMTHGGSSVTIGGQEDKRDSKTKGGNEQTS